MQLSRIDSEIDPVLFAIASRLYHPSRGAPCAYFMFSDVTSEDGVPSRALATTILEQDFGVILQTDATENPRTGNDVIIYVWTINHERFKAWYAEERVKKMRKVGT